MPKPSESSRNLGKLVSLHAVAPIHVQRAAIVAVLSFIFFLAMLVMLSYRQHFGYFLLASAFMAVEIFTLLGLFSQRRNVLKIFEKGFSYKKKAAFWEEIEKIDKNKGYEIVRTDGEKIMLPTTIYEIDAAVDYIETKMLRK
jgi:hypothetical protein